MVIGDGVQVYSRPDGAGGRRPLAAGEMLHHEGLAETFDDYLRDGPDALATGPRGRDLVRAVRADGGALSELDMAAYRVRELVVEQRELRAWRHLGTRQRPRPVRRHGRHPQPGVGRTPTRPNAPGCSCARCGHPPGARRRPAPWPSTGTVTPARQRIRWGWARASGRAGVHGNSMLGEGELLRGELRPGERMPSMMVPLVVTDSDRRLLAAGGAAGGSRIRSALLQVLARVLVDGQPAAEAVAAPRLAATDVSRPSRAGISARRSRSAEREGMRSCSGRASDRSSAASRSSAPTARPPTRAAAASPCASKAERPD